MSLLLLIIAIEAAIIYFFIRYFEPRRKISPVPDGYTGDIVRTYIWECYTRTKKIQLSNTFYISSDVYKNAKNSLLESTPSKTEMFSESDFLKIASEQILHKSFGYSSDVIEQMYQYLKEVNSKEVLSDYETAIVILNFVQEQCIKYEYDVDSTGYIEYFRYPVETIVDSVGDCDCKAVLACALFKRIGFRVAFAVLPGHAAILLSLNSKINYANFNWNGTDWFYCETTGDGWQPGVIPDGINPSEVKFIEI